MKNLHSNSTDTRQTNQSWIRYRPTESHEPKLSFEPLWSAMRGYDRAIASEPAIEPIELSFQKVQKAAWAVKQQYPDLDVQVLAHGQDVFAVN